MGEKMTISTNSYMRSNLLKILKTVCYNIYETILSLKKLDLSRPRLGVPHV